MNIDQYSVALLHFNDDAVTDSIGKYTWQSYETSNVTNEQSKFQNCLKLTGTNSVYCQNFELGGASFTIDCWVYWTGGDRVWSWNTSAVNYVNVEGGSGNFRPHCVNGDGVTTDTNYSNGWHHTAYVYNHDTNEMHFYVDGIRKVLKQNKTVPRQQLTFTIGGETINYNLMQGYIDEFHISDGIARWTNDFTPPSEPWILQTPNDYIHCYKDGTVYNIPLYSNNNFKNIHFKKGNDDLCPFLVNTNNSKASPIRIIINGNVYALKGE